MIEERFGRLYILRVWLESKGVKYNEYAYMTDVEEQAANNIAYAQLNGLKCVTEIYVRKVKL